MNERSIFLSALERTDPAERERYLQTQCAGNAELRRQIDALLAAHTEPDSFMHGPAILGESAVDTPNARTNTHIDANATERSAVIADLLTPSDYPGAIGRLGHYDVLEVVGRGGMGIVLRAFDAKLHRVVALKLMAREFAGSEPARKRFIREAKAAAAVNHDNVVAIHGVDDTSAVPYLVMQFISGCSLEQKIKKEGSLEVKEILRIGLQIANGLAAAHRQGLVHRDIKPPNILLENGVQRVKITDFGLARAVDDASVTQSGVIAGTPQFMSPEQADGRPVDARSDLFSLGSVMYAMCTGRPPFRADSTLATLKRVCEESARPLRQLNPDIPDWLESVIAKLHAKSPDQRYQSAKEVAETLEHCLADLQQGRRPTSVATLATSDVAKDEPSTIDPRKAWARRGGVVATAVLAVIAIMMWSNLLPKFKYYFLYHQLDVRLPDTNTVVEFLETDDTKERENGMSFKMRYPEGGPAALIANRKEAHLRLPAGNYWMTAKRNEQILDRRLLVLGWGGKETLIIADKQANQTAPTIVPGVLCFRFAPGDYTDKIKNLGVVIQVTNTATKQQHREVLKPSMQISTTFPPGEYSIEISETAELKVSATKATVSADKTEEIIIARITNSATPKKGG